MDSSFSSTCGNQEGSAYHGFFECTCHYPLFCFNQFGDLERALLRNGNVHSADDWRSLLEPIVRYHSFRYQAATWKFARRVVAKIEWHTGELYPRVNFVVTNLRRKSSNVVKFYNKRGTAEQWIKEGKFMLVTRCLDMEALILVLLIVWRAGVEVMALNGKSRIILNNETWHYS